MKRDPELVLAARASQAAGEAAGRRALFAVAAATLLIVFVYWSTAASMASIWARSETYAHGYFVVPIALWLTWRARHGLAGLAPRLDPLGFLLLGAAGAAWLAGAAGHAQVVQQYAMVAMVPGAVIALAGRRIAAALAFPLAFLLLAVPAGEGLLPRLMNFTADFTVTALRLSGIPVYREGNFFAIPSGQWSVVEACSGLRYLIAAVTVGAVYAYLSYQKAWKRAVFLALSLAVPILANGLRAYFIVLIGHFSDMKLAVGIDHLVYGWVFFGVVIGLLFWLGSFFRDDEAAPARHANAPAGTTSVPGPATAVALLGVVALSAVWPAYAAYLQNERQSASAALVAPQGVNGWVRQAPAPAGWRPHYQGATASAFALYRSDAGTVALFLARYVDQREGAELVSSANSLAGSPDGPWSASGEAGRAERVGALELQVRETRLRSAGGRLLVWDWYRVAGRDLSDPYLAKALLARDTLLGRGDEAAAVVIAAPYAERPGQAQETLRRFATDMLPAVQHALAAQPASKAP